MAAPPSGSKRALPAAEQRVQPRHFHFGPNPVAVGDDDAADGQAAAAAASPPSAVRLYRDALGCVFQFLRRGEVVTALQVSRGWLAAVKSMRSLRLEIGSPKVPMYALAQSAMGRHVAAIGAYSARATLGADSLYVLALKMPHLSRLICTLRLPPAPTPLFCPLALCRLDLRLPDFERPANVNAALQSIGRLPKLEELTISLQELDPQVSFAPLAALPRLRALHVHCGSAAIALSDAQVDELRALPRLQEANVPMTAPLLRHLLRQPHDLQWQKISLPFQLDDAAAALLPQLPSLTEFMQWNTSGCRRFDWLRGLPNLTNLLIRFGEVDAAGDDSLVAGLAHCTKIEQLAFLDASGLVAARLDQILPRLPRLRDLDLSNLPITSLSFLSQLPTALQLTRLVLKYCGQLPLIELSHVRALRNLQTLTLDSSFNELMDSHSQSLYTPPSVLLPQLRSFLYSPPDELVIGDQNADDGNENDEQGDE